MREGPSSGAGPTLHTARLLLRPQVADDAVVQRRLWMERDPRLPPHRRIDPAGRPTVADIADRIRAAAVSEIGLLTVVQRTTGDVIGYCGLIDTGRGAGGEPELAFELLRRAQGRGYATEASRAVLDRARSSGLARVRATVWDWNEASIRVLTKLGFTLAERTEPRSDHGVSLLYATRLSGLAPALLPSSGPRTG